MELLPIQQAPELGQRPAPEGIDLTSALVQHPLTTFLVQCTSDAMVNAFIPRGALLVVDRSLTPQNGDMVVAAVNGALTVKFLKKNDRRCWLVPANRTYRELEILPGMNFYVWGVVIYTITSADLTRKQML